MSRSRANVTPVNAPDPDPAPIPAAQVPRFDLPDVRVPAGWTLGGLALGLLGGIVLGPGPAGEALLPAIAPIGTLWLRALQMTIVPLVSALLVVGIVRTVAAAQAGAMARRTLGLFFAVLASGTLMAALATPLLLELVPVPADAAAALQGAIITQQPPPVPALADFLQSLVPVNVVASAAEGAILPVIVFFALFAVAITRLPPEPRRALSVVFEGLAGAMMVVIGWVLKLAPIGVFALSFAVAAQAGTAALGALAHYIAVVAGIGGVVLLAGYGLAITAARQPLAGFARAMLPAQAVAISTQSSLASVPAMLASCRALGLRDTSGEFVLPLAVALFRATGPAMNLAVAIYVAHLTGVELTAQTLAAGVLVALLTTLGSPSLPGAISFVSAIGPIALAMGVPLAPLALLVAVEVLPDIMRTVGNVTMDVAVAATVDRKSQH
jgi:Na+/H+-dicarboxylate symporter